MRLPRRVAGRAVRDVCSAGGVERALCLAIRLEREPLAVAVTGTGMDALTVIAITALGAVESRSVVCPVLVNPVRGHDRDRRAAQRLNLRAVTAEIGVAAWALVLSIVSLITG